MKNRKYLIILITILAFCSIGNTAWAFDDESGGGDYWAFVFPDGSVLVTNGNGQYRADGSVGNVYHSYQEFVNAGYTGSGEYANGWGSDGMPIVPSQDPNVSSGSNVLRMGEALAYLESNSPGNYTYAPSPNYQFIIKFDENGKYAGIIYLKDINIPVAAPTGSGGGSGGTSDPTPEEIYMGIVDHPEDPGPLDNPFEFYLPTAETIQVPIPGVTPPDNGTKPTTNELPAEFQGNRTYVSPGGTAFTLPPGSQVDIYTNYDQFYLPNGAVYGFKTPDGKRYAAKMSMVTASGTVGVSTPLFQGYYEVVDKKIDESKPFPGNVDYPQPDNHGVIKSVRLRIRKNNDGNCELFQELVDFTPTPGSPGSLSSSSVDADDAIESAGSSIYVSYPILCPQSPFPSSSDLDKYVRKNGERLKKFLRDKVKNKTTIYLKDCATDKIKYTISGSGVTAVPNGTNLQPGNPATGDDIYIIACIENGQFKNYSGNFVFGSNLNPDPRVAPVFTPDFMNELDAQARDEVKNLTGVNSKNPDQKIPAGNGEEFYKEGMDLLESLAAIYDVGKEIAENGALPESMWDQGHRSNSTTPIQTVKDAYDKSPFHITSIIGGGTDQVIDEVTGPLQLLKAGLQFIRDPQGTFNGIWNGVKSIDKDKLMQIAGNATGITNYTAGGERATYQAGKHAVWAAMIFMTWMKSLSKGADVVEGAGKEMTEIQDFMPPGNTNTDVADALKNAATHDKAVTKIDGEKLITENVGQNGESIVVAVEKDGTNINKYDVKASDMTDPVSGTTYTMDDIVEGAKDIDKPKTPKGVNPTTNKPQIETDAGSKGGWNKTLNNPEPNTEYLVKNSGNSPHKYTTDANGRVTKVEGELTLQPRDRNGYQQSVKCNKSKDGLPGDQGGHLIGSRFDGAGEQINVVPMNSNVNLSAWKQMENQWANELQAGHSVRVEIRPVYNFTGTSKRPIGFEVDSWINGVKQGIQTFNN